MKIATIVLEIALAIFYIYSLYFNSEFLNSIWKFSSKWYLTPFANVLLADCTVLPRSLHFWFPRVVDR